MATPMVLARMRAKVAEYSERHLYESAVFLADKLVTMSGGDEQDVYALAQAYFRSGLHRRAIHAIKQAGLVTTDDPRHNRFRFLVAKCCIAKEEWEEALKVLGAHTAALHEPAPSDGGADYRSSMSLLRGTVYDAMDEKDQAVLAYQRALQLDCCCYEAFHHLTQHHLLDSGDEQKLIASIEFGEADTWLQLLYNAKVTRYQAAPESGPELPGPPPSTEQMEVDASSGRESTPPMPPPSTPAVAYLNQLERKHSLEGDLDLLSQRAEVQYYSHHYRSALAICRTVLEQDPHHLSCLPVYLCTLHEMAQKNELFYQAHQLVEQHPQKAVAWFAVGCYYHLTGNFDSARRYFEKATNLDNWFAPSWLGLGNAYAAQDESDQAMVQYRIAAKLFPGCHFCPLFVGMECARTNNLPLATKYFERAQEICPAEPLVYHELGVVHYKNNELPKAKECFLRVLSLCGPHLDPWETTLFNLGHTCRKLRQYDEAIVYYTKALLAQPNKASTHSALGFSYHLKGELHRAIDYYHQALGLRSEDTFAAAMLRNAFDEMSTAPAPLM